MGIATLWVVHYHYRSYATGFLDFFGAIGYGGVDIFLFLSGFGLTIGWLKGLSNPMSPVKRVSSFYFRRLLRTFPTLFLLSLVWARHNYLPWGKAIAASTGIGWYIHKIPYWDWFMPSMFAFYLFFPLWMWINRKAMQKPSNRTVLYNCILGVLLSIALTITVILTGNAGMNMLQLSRIPIFLIGSWFGYYYHHRHELTKSFYICAAVVASIGMCLFVPYVLNTDFYILWRYGFFWHPFIIIVPGLLFLLSWGFNYCHRWIKIPFRFFGSISFEFYLMHCLYFEFMNRHFPDAIPQHPYISFLLLLIVVGFLSWIFLFCTNSILRKLGLIKN